jgi:TRAP-type C4-dicarboxylate transport system substrate-binding protein
MSIYLSRRAFVAATAAGLTTPMLSLRARSETQGLRLRCSLETVPSHSRNISIRDYLGKVEAASNGAIKPEIFESGQLYSDLAVIKALIQEQVEMAVPGYWTITGILPDADFFQLPALYGRSVDVVHRMIDGKPGALLAMQIEQKIKTHVLGAWLDLGYFTWYTTNRPLGALMDLKGLKIRNPGGAGQGWRARFFDAVPNTTALPNVPLALSQGTFDGIVTTNETIVSLQLWDAGVKYALEDKQCVGEYIPMISLSFWNRLSPDLQKLMTDIWLENIPIYRANMAKSQTNARVTMETHGIKFTDPKAEEIIDIRKTMIAAQQEAATESKISSNMVEAVMAEVKSID